MAEMASAPMRKQMAVAGIRRNRPPIFSILRVPVEYSSAPAAQEQLALKHRVVKRVVEGGHQSQDGDADRVERHGGYGGADAEQNDAMFSTE